MVTGARPDGVTDLGVEFGIAIDDIRSSAPDVPFASMEMDSHVATDRGTNEARRRPHRRIVDQ
jgi:hypothetical protein